MFVLFLGAVMAAAWYLGFKAAQFRTAREEGAPGDEQPPAAPADGQTSRRSAPELQPELEVLNRLGLTLAGQLDMERLVQAVTDAGVAITGAAFGAFVYRDASGGWSSFVSGAPRDALTDFSLPRDADGPGAPFPPGVARIDDVTRDPSQGHNLPFQRMPPGVLPARSYLAAPVRSGTSAPLGGLFFGHPDPGAFEESDERLLAGLAAHAAVAAGGAHLYREAEKARSAAEAANRVKDQFLATLSHELRTPLTAIVGWAHLLERGLPPDEMARAVDVIIQSATAQNQIIDELLDVSRIVTGKLQIDLRPVDVTAVVEAAIATVTPAASAKGIRLEVVHDPAGTHVVGDPERLQQVFWNLFANAVKFTPRNGRVRVSVECVGSSVEVVVADSGLGIDVAFLPRVFDQFTQDDSSSTRPARGLGLGLFIARQLVELHGGSILAESPGVGHGSTFTARLPRSAAVAAPLDLRAFAKASRIIGLDEGPDLSGIRVLVVEDDDDARGLLEKVLETQGAIVKTASSAPEALDILGREPLDMLVSDIEMPGTDGYQLIRELRQRPPQRGGSVPAAALTAYARAEDRLRALRAGFQLHLAKPVQPSELVAVVASLAARRG